MKTDSFKIINSNLREADWYFSYSEKIKKGELYELLHMLISNSEYSPNTVVSYFKAAFDVSLCSPAYAAFCSLAAQHLADKLYSEIFPSQDGWSLTENKKENIKIAVFQNKYSDAAVSKLYPEAEILYTHDYVSSCEEVFYSRADAAILPFASSSEGQFVSFFKLASKYDLYMTKRVSVSISEEDNIMDFALYGRHIKPCDSPCFFYVLLPDTTPEILASFILSIKNTGGYVVSVNYSNETHMQSKTMVLIEIHKYALTAVVLFLKTVFPGFVPLGLFEYIPGMIYQDQK